MTTNQILVAARALIENPENWTRVLLARNKDGNATKASSPEACMWCALGAVFASTDSAEGHALAGRALSREMQGLPIPTYNDSHTHAEVLAAFDRAIEATKEQP